MKSLSREAESEIINFYKKGETTQTIADLLDISLSTAHKYIHKNINRFEIRDACYLRDSNRDQEILDMCKSGLTYREVGKRFNISGERVRQIVARTK
jgi:DNA-binding CsgD family transcriptional regulator